MRSRILLYVIVLALATGITPNLFAAVTHATVGLCAGSGTHYIHIQDAVNAVSSSPGAVIGVCPNNYPEQVMITSSLTLQGLVVGNQDAVVILPPTTGVVNNSTDQRGDVAAMVLVQGANPVTITNVTVDGTGNQYTGDGDLRGLLFQDASGTVNHVAVRNIVPNDTPTGDQSGQGIMVETTNTSSASLSVENCSVHNYNKNGIVGRYAGSVLNATANFVQGNGPTGLIAQNGIEIAFDGAKGNILNNNVIDNYYISPASPNNDTASDILLYDAAEDASMEVQGNTVGSSNIPISLHTVTPGTYGDGVYVRNNKVYGSASNITAPSVDGIDLCTNNNVATGNFIYNSSQSGIHLDTSCGVTVSGSQVTNNTFVESACAGILQDAAAGSNTTTPNNFSDVPFKVASSTGSCTIPAGPSAARAHNKAKPRP
jgi:hypothetical protein